VMLQDKMFRQRLSIVAIFKRFIILKLVVISVGYHVSMKALPSSRVNVG